ncbi:MAG: hypothetical protein HYX52_04600 [Chloroflexi bacterium]|nr:hypothetical protein [Chloroflexota bacterium]
MTRLSLPIHWRICPRAQTVPNAIRRTSAESIHDPAEPLDQAAKHSGRFGSYVQLFQMDELHLPEGYVPASQPPAPGDVEPHAAATG